MSQRKTYLQFLQALTAFEKRFEAAEIAKFSPDEKHKYEESLKYYRDLKNVVDTSFDEGKAEGKAEGLAEGKAEGLAEGKAEGLAIGKQERNREIARDMKRKGLDLSIIADITGLSTPDIEQL